MRHAAAGDRSASGRSCDQPITKRTSPPRHWPLPETTRISIYASPYTRCQTVEPLANHWVKVIEHTRWPGADIDGAYGLADELVGYNGLCTHGDVIPAV
jgi:hypothetical protein